MILKNILTLFAICLSCGAAEVNAIRPKNGIAPIGPYSPGVFAGNYLYVSGQGANRPDGEMAGSFEEQARQTMQNVKAVVEAAGLTMQNVVYTQVYLDNMANFRVMNRVYAEYFHDTPPARATLGVAMLPGNTPIEINAVAIRDLSEKKAVSVKGLSTDEPLSPGILTNDRLFISALRSPASDPEKEVELALDSMRSVLEAAGLKMENVVFVNPYLTGKIPSKIMNNSYAKRFEFGNTPARATIKVTSLPENAQIEFTGVAVRNIQLRKAIRPKNMPPSPTASPCVFAGDTLYCSAKSGFVPGPNGGVFTPAVDLQIRQSMRNLLDNLEEAGLTFENVVSTNVYLDDLADFSTINEIYAKYFTGIAPARTTIKQVASVGRSKRADGTYAELEQVSLVAVQNKSHQ
ncbi:MAG TPA: RidA family protein [Bryobacteraceae bacterium]|jgi:reactive intermediate/imine deaminase|nr:RidA family protein [Bryobacteraceae bacterium]